MVTSNTGKDYDFVCIKTSVFFKEKNPIFGEGVTHISIEDEASGPYLVISQESETGMSSIKVDVDELEIILEAAKKLYTDYVEVVGDD